jgi:FlaA1/EpsC-like NDP-sugar epimerase
LFSDAIELLGLDGRDYWSIFFGAFQRFFRSLCISAKTDVLVDEINRALAKDQCVIIGLQSTGEAVLNRMLDKSNDRLSEFVSDTEATLRETIEHLPLSAKIDEDKDGDDDYGSVNESEDEDAPKNKRRKKKMNSTSNVCPSKVEALKQRRNEILEIMTKIQFPPNFLDDILNVIKT